MCRRRESQVHLLKGRDMATLRTEGMALILEIAGKKATEVDDFGDDYEIIQIPEAPPALIVYKVPIQTEIGAMDQAPPGKYNFSVSV